MPDVTSLPPLSVIGIIGGGQLGRMACMAASRLGYHVHVYATHPNDPACELAQNATIGAFDDLQALTKFAHHVEVITFEFENISSQALACLSDNRPVYPASNILEISQDRIKEKSALAAINVKTADWRELTCRDDIHDAFQALGDRLIVKTTRLGYDGKGQYRINGRQDCIKWDEFSYPLIAEQCVDFACEISVIVARGLGGQTETFEAAQNVHREGILHYSFIPAQIDPALTERAQDLARHIAEAFDHVGLLAIEMFVTRDGQLLVNEIAPRPHNSGHWTMDACIIDQFEMHVRAVTGLPLPPMCRHSDVVMRNLIGPQGLSFFQKNAHRPNYAFHLYGKSHARKGRKMGHANLLFPRGALHESARTSLLEDF